MGKKEQQNCFICQNRPAYYYGRKNDYDLYRCSECGIIFVRPLPNDCGTIYQENYFHSSGEGSGYANYEGDKDILSKNFKKYLDRLEIFSIFKGKLLDVGAATGNFIESALLREWTASGVEISEYASRIAKEKGLDVVNGKFELYEWPLDNFDVVTFWDVLEHFSEPEKSILKAQKIIKPGGLLAINTPDSSSFLSRFFRKNWHLLVPPEHLNCFSLKSLEKLLKRNNFEIVYVGRVGKSFSLRYIFKTLSNWHNFFLWEKLYNFLSSNRIGNLEIPLNTYDNMFVIARKRKIHNE